MLRLPREGVGVWEDDKPLRLVTVSHEPAETLTDRGKTRSPAVGESLRPRRGNFPVPGKGPKGLPGGS